MPTPSGDRRAGHQQLRTPLGMGRQLLAQPQRDESAVTQVADGGDAGGQRRPCPGAALLQQLVVVHVGEVADGVVAGVQHQVGVAVDQPWQQGRLAEVDQLCTLGRVGPGNVNVYDAPLVHQHQRAGTELVGHPVEQPCRTDRQHPGHLPRAAITLQSASRILGAC